AIGMCERTVREVFVDGERRLIPYLGSLRIAPSHRHRIRILKGGFDLLRLSALDSPTVPYSLTSIGAQNRVALRLLGAGIAGMPTYRRVGSLSTFAPRPPRRRAVSSMVERATSADLPAIAVRLGRSYRHLQFAPLWRAVDLASQRRCPGLHP